MQQTFRQPDNRRIWRRFINHNGEFTTAKTCVQQIIEGCIDIAGEVGSQKIGDPVSKYKAGNIQEAIYAVESWYSWHSREDYRNNIYSIRNAYYGTLDGTVADNSISKIIEGSNSTLNNNVKQAINKAATAIWGIPQPFRNNINSSEAEEAMEACSDLETVLKELNSYIGSTASINSDAILQPVVKTYVEVVVLPTYASLKSKVDALYDAVIALSNSPSIQLLKQRVTLGYRHASHGKSVKPSCLVRLPAWVLTRIWTAGH